MGFGSYDESEQENQQQNDHDGEVTFESDADTDELISKLGDIKDETAD
jgi:hypothetical protein